MKNLYQVVSILFVLFSHIAYSATVTSKGAQGAVNWSTGTVWVGDAKPVAGDDVIISPGDLITLDESITVNSLTINDDASVTSLTVGAFTLTVTTNIDLTPTVGFDDITLATSASASSIITVGGNLNFNTVDGTETISLTLAANSTLSIGGAFVLNAGSIVYTIDAASTINYNGSGAQTVITPFTYGNLTADGSGIKTANGNLTVAGNLSYTSTLDLGTNLLSLTGTPSGAGTLRTANTANPPIPSGKTYTGTVEFYSTSSQSVPGATFNNLNLSAAAGTKIARGAVTVSGTLTNAFTLSMGVNTLSDGGALSTSGSGTIVTGNTGATPIPSGITYSGTVQYNSGSAQTVVDANYNNLTISGARNANSVTISNSSTLGVAGTLTLSATFTSGTYIMTGTTIDFNGTSGQTITNTTNGSFAYNNLTISGDKGAGTITLPASTISINGTFSVTATNIGAYSLTGNTIDFKSSGSQNIPAFNYNNITNTGGGARTLASSGTIGIAGAYTPTAGATTITGSTVDFNGTAAQSINAVNYNNLTISGDKGTGAVTLASGTIDVAGTMSVTATNTSWVNTGNTVNFSGTTTTLSGSGAPTFNNLTVSAGTLSSSVAYQIDGTLTPTGSITNTSNTVTFGGTTPSIAAGAGTSTFNNITISGTANLTVANSITLTGAITNTAGTFNQTTGTLTASGTTSITGSGTHTVNNFTISSGTFTAPSALTVNGDFANSGTFTHNSGTVTLGGTTTTNFPGAATTFNNITVTNTNGTGATMNAAVNLIGTLDLSTTNAKITTTGQTFTLKSTGIANSATARIGPLGTGATITGNITLERYISGANGWRIMGCPVSSLSLEDWKASIYMSGSWAGAENAAGFESVYTYNEASAAGVFGNGFVLPTDSSDAVSADDGTLAGRGYMLFVADGYPGNIASPITVSQTGAPIVGNVTPFAFSATKTGVTTDDGYNLMANPYPCPVDFDNFAFTTGSTTAHVYDPNTDSWLTRNGGAGTLTNGIIGSNQAFFVEVANSGTITVEEGDKVTSFAGGETFYRESSRAVLPEFGLEIASGINPYQDRSLVYFSQGATDAFDNNEGDASKIDGMTGAAPMLSFVSSDGKSMAIDRRPELTAGTSIDVLVTVPINGTYTISNFRKNNIGSDICISLYDNQTATTIDITNQSYTFTASTATTTPRFVLSFTPGANITAAVVATEPSCSGSSNAQLVAQASSSGTYQFTWKDGNGNILASNSSTDSDTLKNITGGDYIVEVSTGAVCGTYIQNITIAEPVANQASHTITNTSCNTVADGSIIIEGLANGPFTYNLYDSNNALINTVSSAAGTSFDNLAAGSYTVEAVFNNTCGTYFQNAIVAEPVANQANHTVTDATCDETSDGSVYVEGLTNGPFTYKLYDSNNALINTISSASGVSFDYLATGSYVVEAIFNNSCGIYTQNITIAESVINQASHTISDATCNAVTDGSISVEGLTNGPFTYNLYDSNNSLINTASSASAATFSNLSAGSYTVEAVFNNACGTYTQNVTVSEPLANQASHTISDATCNSVTDGSISVEGLSNGPFTYNLYDANNSLINTASSASAATFSNLSAGSYTVEAVFNNACGTYTQNVTVSEPLANQASHTISDATCNSVTDGSISVEGLSNGPFTYNLYDSNNSLINTASSTSAATFSNLSAGSYTVEAVFNNACGTYNQNVIIAEPLAPVSMFGTNGDTISLASGLPFVFTNTSQNANVYSWNFGDGVGTSVDQNPTYTYTQVGTYTIELSASFNSCPNISSSSYTVVVVDQTTSINSLNNSRISFVNSFNNKGIKYELATGEKIKVNFYNVLGQKLMEEIVLKNSSGYIDLNNLETKSQTVIVEVRNDSDVIYKKISFE